MGYSTKGYRKIKRLSILLIAVVLLLVTASAAYALTMYVDTVDS